MLTPGRKPAWSGDRTACTRGSSISLNIVAKTLLSVLDSDSVRVPCCGKSADEAFGTRAKKAKLQPPGNSPFDIQST